MVVRLCWAIGLNEAVLIVHSSIRFSTKVVKNSIMLASLLESSSSREEKQEDKRSWYSFEDYFERELVKREKGRGNLVIFIVVGWISCEIIACSLFQPSIPFGPLIMQWKLNFFSSCTWVTFSIGSRICSSFWTPLVTLRLQSITTVELTVSVGLDVKFIFFSWKVVSFKTLYHSHRLRLL